MYRTYMKWMITLIWSAAAISATVDYSLVFVYLGDRVPDYVVRSVAQARLFNPDCPIYFIVHERTLAPYAPVLDAVRACNVEVVVAEQLPTSQAHQAFDQMCTARPMVGYWRYTQERFFYVHELMEQYQLANCVQVECDVMMYLDLAPYIPLLRSGAEIACPFVCDYLASVSIVYFAHAAAAADYVRFVAEHAQGQVIDADMYMLAAYRNAHPDRVDHLPTIPNEVIHHSPFKNGRGEMPVAPWLYWHNFHQWQSIFDHDGIGYSLFKSGVGMDKAYYNTAWFQLVWHPDAQGRKVPYVQKNHLRYRLNTLHIISKQLEQYCSW